jgi:hypothetical protein
VGVEPTSPAWKAGAFAARPRARALSKRKERESNPQGSSLDRFRNGCHRGHRREERWSGLPFRKAAATGIEPVSGRLTAACSYQHELHRNTVGVVRFGLTISCAQGRRIPRLSHTPHKSIQRESNPHFRHGEPAGFRYIMDANIVIGLSKNRHFREHRVGLEPTFPHYGCGVLAAERPVPVSQWDQRDLNPHLLG